jgi:hypothetical protein
VVEDPFTLGEGRTTPNSLHAAQFQGEHQTLPSTRAAITDPEGFSFSTVTRTPRMGGEEHLIQVGVAGAGGVIERTRRMRRHGLVLFRTPIASNISIGSGRSSHSWSTNANVSSMVQRGPV